MFYPAHEKLGGGGLYYSASKDSVFLPTPQPGARDSHVRDEQFQSLHSAHSELKISEEDETEMAWNEIFQKDATRPHYRKTPATQPKHRQKSVALSHKVSVPQQDPPPTQFISKSLIDLPAATSELSHEDYVCKRDPRIQIAVLSREKDSENFEKDNATQPHDTLQSVTWKTLTHSRNRTSTDTEREKDFPSQFSTLASSGYQSVSAHAGSPSPPALTHIEESTEVTSSASGGATTASTYELNVHTESYTHFKEASTTGQQLLQPPTASIKRNSLYETVDLRPEEKYTQPHTPVHSLNSYLHTDVDTGSTCAYIPTITTEPKLARPQHLSVDIPDGSVPRGRSPTQIRMGVSAVKSPQQSVRSSARSPLTTNSYEVSQSATHSDNRSTDSASQLSSALRGSSSELEREIHDIRYAIFRLQNDFYRAQSVVEATPSYQIPDYMRVPHGHLQLSPAHPSYMSPYMLYNQQEPLYGNLNRMNELEAIRRRCELFFLELLFSRKLSEISSQQARCSGILFPFAKCRVPATSSTTCSSVTCGGSRAHDVPVADAPHQLTADQPTTEWARGIDI